MSERPLNHMSSMGQIDAMGKLYRNADPVKARRRFRAAILVGLAVIAYELFSG